MSGPRCCCLLQKPLTAERKEHKYNPLPCHALSAIVLHRVREILHTGPRMLRHNTSQEAPLPHTSMQPAPSQEQRVQLPSNISNMPVVQSLEASPGAGGNLKYFSFRRSPGQQLCQKTSCKAVGLKQQLNSIPKLFSFRHGQVTHEESQLLSRVLAHASRHASIQGVLLEDKSEQKTLHESSFLLMYMCTSAGWKPCAASLLESEILAGSGSLLQRGVMDANLS